MIINSDRLEISNPILYYKLDPGEPGLATPARASESVARVASHEIGNIVRFKKETSERGGIIVYSNIFLNMQFAGSFLAATSGLSEVYIIYPAKKNNKEINMPELEKDKRNKDFNKGVKSDKDNGKSNEVNDKSKISIRDELKNGSIENIENKIKELENEKIQMKSKQSKDADKRNLSDENKIREIDAKITYLEQKKMLEEQKELFQKFAEASSFPFSLIGLKYKSEINDFGSLVDSFA